MDRADAFQPGQGRLELLGTATPDWIGGRAECVHRIEPSLSAFAQGWAGWANRASRWERDWGATVGARWTF